MYSITQKTEKIKARHEKIKAAIECAGEAAAILLTLNGALSAWAICAASVGAYVPGWMWGSVAVSAAAIAGAIVWAFARLGARVAEAIRPRRRLGLIDSYTVVQLMARRCR